MRDLPISFSPPMVRGLIRKAKAPGTGKTQTRRVLMATRNGTPVEMHPSGRSVPFNDPEQWGFPYYDASSDSTDIMFLPDYAKLRYAVGQRLWVREAWRVGQPHDKTKPSEILEPLLARNKGVTVLYEAGGWRSVGPVGRDEPDYPHDMPMPKWAGKRRPGMFMPRWASRLTLTVTDVRVQRVQEISEADAIAEGVEYLPDGTPELGNKFAVNLMLGYASGVSAVEAYRVLWDVLNSARGFGWDANPFVVAVSFTVHLGNIDQVSP